MEYILPYGREAIGATYPPQSIACDFSGNIYLASIANDTSGNIATINAHQKEFGGVNDGFLVKFDSSGEQLWATYYGGKFSDGITGVACDKNNNVYIVGYTTSDENIATTGSYSDSLNQYAYGSAAHGSDAFIAKFDSAGLRQWGTYYGSNYFDSFTDIIIDPHGDLAMVGVTFGDSLSTPGSWRSYTEEEDQSDVIFTKFTVDGERLWATYFGGQGEDLPTKIACDQSGNYYFGGATNSLTGIATQNAHQTGFGGARFDLFLAKALSDSLIYIQCDSSFCLNPLDTTIEVGVYPAKSFYPGNVFTVQLSNASGSFSNPINIGQFAATASCMITCAIPSNIARGKGYRIRVLASSPAYTSTTNGFDIAIRDAPLQPVATGDSVLCSGRTLNLHATCATSGVSFCWSGPNKFSSSSADTTRPNINLADSGNYVVTAIHLGCKTSDTLYVKVERSPYFPLIVHNTPLCEGDTLRFNHRPDLDPRTTYKWTYPPYAGYIPKQNNVIDSATTLFTGMYTIVSTLDNCVETDSTFMTVNYKPQLTATSNNSLKTGETLKLQAIVDSFTSFSWTGPAGFFSELTNSSLEAVTVNNAGIYIAAATYNTCTDSVQLVVDVTPIGDDIFLLFPNPNNGKFTILGTLSLDQDLQIRITNSIGQEIYRERITTNNKILNKKITLPAVASGSYMLHMRINGKAKTIPFIVVK